MNRRWINGCLVVFLMFVVPFFCVMTASGVGFFRTITRNPEEVEITIHRVPVRIAVDESLRFFIRITNRADHTQMLHSIDVSLSLLNGFEVERTVPAYVETQELFNLQTFYFLQEIGPGESLEVEFVGRGKDTGRFSGWIDACVNTPFSCATFEHVFTVTN